MEYFKPGKIELSPSGDILELSSMQKKINQESDMTQWSMSPAYQALQTFILTICQAIKSTSTNTSTTIKPVIKNLIEAFDILKQYLDQIPPEFSPQRFGNKAYRVWLSKVWENRASILSKVTDNPEAQEYFCQSFGSWTRIDYGTGHELNFVAFLACLSSLNLINITPNQDSDSLAVAFHVFPVYWELVISVQCQYHLEAAGSHGAWGLDDFFSLPFVFGSSQLIDHSFITPANVIDYETAKNYRNDSIYCEWICKLKEKNCPRSRLLYFLKVIPNFQKLHEGMLRMYNGELLDRYLVMQHFRFGTILSWE